MYEEDTDNDVVGAFLTLDNNDAILNYTLTFKTSAETDITAADVGDELQQTTNLKILKTRKFQFLVWNTQWLK